MGRRILILLLPDLSRQQSAGITSLRRPSLNRTSDDSPFIRPHSPPLPDPISSQIRPSLEMFRGVGSVHSVISVFLFLVSVFTYLDACWNTDSLSGSAGYAVA